MLCAFNTVASIKQSTGPPPTPGIVVTGLPNGTYVATVLRAATTSPTPIFYLPLQGNTTNYGTIASTPTSTSPQYLALANPVFNGNYNGNYITINNTIFYNKLNYTIACWVYVNNFGSNNWICSNQFDSNNSMAMLSLTCYTDTGGTFQSGTSGYVYYRPRNNTGNIVSTKAITTGNWAHIAVSCSSNSGTIYINGVQSGTTVDSSMNLLASGGTGVSSIGAWTSPYLISISKIYRFDGLISDFRVYDYALNSTQVQDLYNMRVHYPSITVSGNQYTFDNLQINKDYNLYLSTSGATAPSYTRPLIVRPSFTNVIPMPSLYTLAIDIGGNIYTANFGSTINKYIKSSGTIITITTGVASINNIAIANTGNIYFQDHNGGGIYNITNGTGISTSSTITPTQIATARQSSQALCVDNITGNIYYGTYIDKTICRITPTGSGYTVVFNGASVPGLTEVRHICFDNYQNMWFVSKNETTRYGNIWTIDSGNLKLNNTNVTRLGVFDKITTAIVSQNNNIYFVHETANVYIVNPDRTTYSEYTKINSLGTITGSWDMRIDISNSLYVRTTSGVAIVSDTIL